MLVQAHNGSGKTTCFVLAMLSRVDENVQRTQALCICPTRELVVQNLEITRKMGKYTNIKAISTATDLDLPRYVLSRHCIAVMTAQILCHDSCAHCGICLARLGADSCHTRLCICC